MIRPCRPARRLKQYAGPLLCCVEIGEEAAGRGELGPGRAAETIERRQAEPRFEAAFAGYAVEPALAGGRGDACHRAISNRFCRPQPGKLGGKIT